MRKIGIFLVSIIFLFVCEKVVIQAEGNEKFGPEGEKRIIELTKWLETNPLDQKGKEVRAEVLEWWIEAPHVTLNWCANLLIEGKNKKITGTVIIQGTFGAGAFILENPDRNEDSSAYSLAGVESGLLAYKNAVSENKKMKDKFYDSLVNRQKTGNLEKYIADSLKICKEAEGE